MHYLGRTVVLPAAFVTALGASLALGTRQSGAVTLNVVPVAGDVHCLYGRGGNIALLAADEGVVMVDSQFAELSGDIAIAAQDLGHGPVDWLVNTHWHADHTGGNESFGTTANVVAHANVRRRLIGDTEIGGTVREDAPAAALPVVTYSTGATLQLAGETIQLWHIGPGHTDGDTVVWFENAKVCHMGDVFFQSSYPYVDLGSGGDVRGMLATVEEVLRRLPEGARVIPGHGEVSDRAGLEEYREMLFQVITRVEEALADGRSTQAILEARLLDDLNPRWGGGTFMTPERFLPIMVENLRR